MPRSCLFGVFGRFPSSNFTWRFCIKFVSTRIEKSNLTRNLARHPRETETINDIDTRSASQLRVVRTEGISLSRRKEAAEINKNCQKRQLYLVSWHFIICHWICSHPVVMREMKKSRKGERLKGKEQVTKCPHCNFHDSNTNIIDGTNILYCACLFGPF